MLTSSSSHNEFQHVDPHCHSLTNSHHSFFPQHLNSDAWRDFLGHRAVTRGGGLGSRPIFKKFHETYAPS